MNKNLLLSMLFTIGCLHLQAQIWTQIGNDINGTATENELGKAVAINSDGSIIAVGAPGGEVPGYVRIYEKQNGIWVQLGADLVGENDYDKFGATISISGDGYILAVGGYRNDGNGSDAGHVRIYAYQNGSWGQIGNDIDGESTGDESGFSLDLNYNGSVIAIGARNNGGTGAYAGHVRIYENQNGSWLQLGADIDALAADDWFGFSVSIDSLGSTVAIGAPGKNHNTGQVRVFENQNGSWIQIGSSIDGGASGDELGEAVSLSADGTIVAIGSTGNNLNTGLARAYQKQNGTWVQIGTDIVGEASGDEFGHAVSLSADGTTLAVGAYMNDGNGFDAGHVRIFKYQGGIWTQIGSDIDGEFLADRSGYALGLDAQGTSVIIGAYENTNSAGHARVYSTVPSTNITNLSYSNKLLVFPNPTQGIIHARVPGLTILNGVVTDVTGRVVSDLSPHESEEITMSLSGMEKGVYFLYFYTNEGLFVAKILKD